MNKINNLIIVKLIFTLLLLNSCNNIKTNHYEDYVGKEIKKMISAPKYSDYAGYQFFDSKPRVLTGIRLIYKDRMIELYVSDFNHVKAYNLEGNWDFKKVIKEKISRIIIYDNEDNVIHDSHNFAN